jgi:hypothetical protein
MAKHNRKSFRFIGTARGSQIWTLGSAVTIDGQLLKNPEYTHERLLLFLSGWSAIQKLGANFRAARYQGVLTIDSDKPTCGS